MNNYIKYPCTILVLVTTLISCNKNPVLPENHYYNTLSFADSSDSHPKNLLYQKVIDDYVSSGAVGLSIMINDQYGTWLGAGGYADLTSGVQMQTGNQFLIASISKTFTATCIYTYVDDGLLSLDDPINKWIDDEIINKIDNGNESQIKHLLSHRSGIHDIYTIAMNMDLYNTQNNGWTQMDMLEYVYGKKANFEVDQGYSYSNTNYLLLGMILEKVSGKSLKEVYAERIFQPLNLNSAYYGTGDNAAPAGVVKGYADLYGNGKYIYAHDYYMDEIGVGGDGGIAINAQDLGVFMHALVNGNLISQNSLDEMRNWFDLDLYDGAEQTKNGYGLEYFEKPHGGIAYGHPGGIEGFWSLMLYYPNHDVYVVVLFNFALGTQENYDAFQKFEEDLGKAIFD